MAQLQWRDVAAPNFSGAMEGVDAASRLINSALNQAQGGVREYQKIQDDALNSRLMAQLVGMDSADDAAAIPGMIAGVKDPSRISSDVFSLMMGRKGQLTQQELGDLNLRDTRNTSDRNMAFQHLLDAATPEIQAYNAAVAANDPKAIAATRAAVFNKVQGGPAEKFLALSGQLSGMESSALGIVGSRQRIGIDAENQGWTREDRVFDQKAAEIAGQIQLGGALTRDDYEAMARNMGLDGRLFEAVMRRAPQFSDFGGYAPPDLLGGGGADSNALRAITGGGEGNLGIGSVPANVTTLGQAVQFGKSLNNRGQASSAMGLFQITQSTMEEFAPKAFGANWQNQRFDDPRVQDAVARKIFEDAISKRNPGEALRGRWVSLSPQDAARVARMPWEQAREIISQKESSSSVGALIAQAAGQAVDNTQRRSAFVETNAGDNLALNFANLAGSTETPAQVARRIAKELPGANPAWVEERIISLQSKIAGAGGSRRKVNAAMVGQALLDNAGAQSAREGWYNPKRWLPDSFRGNTLGEDITVDMDAAYNSLDGYAKGRMDDRIAANTAMAATAGVQANAQQQYQAAKARYDAKVRAAQTKGIRNPNLNRELADLRIAESNYMGAMGQPSGGLPGRDESRQAPSAPAPQRQAQRPAPAPAPKPAPRQVAPQAPRQQVAERPWIKPEQRRAMEAAANRDSKDAGGWGVQRAFWGKAGEAIANALTPSKVTSPRGGNGQSGLQRLDSILDNASYPVGTTRSQVLAQRNELARQQGKPLRK